MTMAKEQMRREHERYYKAPEGMTDVARIKRKAQNRREKLAKPGRDEPHDESYADDVLFCPQYETPYSAKQDKKQCHRCGTSLPK